MANQMGDLEPEDYANFRTNFTLQVPQVKEKAEVSKDEAKVQASTAKAPVSIQARFWHPSRVLDPGSFVLPATCTLISHNVRLPVFRMNVTDIHCLNVMQEIRHPNILRPLSIIDGVDNCYTLLVEPYEGNLVQYFEDVILNRANTIEDVIRTVQIVFRQVVDAIIYLMENDLFHGDFKLQNTYYCMEDHKPVVKLANFNGGGWAEVPDFESSKLPSEWISIGNAIDQIVTLISENRVDFDLRILCEMQDLAIELKTSKTTPDQKKELVPHHFFFWSPEKRGSVFTFNIPNYFLDQKFVDKVIKLFVTPSQFVWNDNSYSGLLAIMNDHRELIGKSKYNGEEKTQYLRFVSGSYAHEKEFKVNLYLKTVDATLRKWDPDLLLRVMKVVKAYLAEK